MKRCPGYNETSDEECSGRGVCIRNRDVSECRENDKGCIVSCKCDENFVDGAKKMCELTEAELKKRQQQRASLFDTLKTASTSMEVDSSAIRKQAEVVKSLFVPQEMDESTKDVALDIALSLASQSSTASTDEGDVGIAVETRDALSSICSDILQSGKSDTVLQLSEISDSQSSTYAAGDTPHNDSAAKLVIRGWLSRLSRSRQSLIMCSRRPLCR